MRRHKGLGAPSSASLSSAITDASTPPAMTHGLTSRRLREALNRDAEVLAPALIGGAYPDQSVIEAARAAADAILHLHHIRRAKLDLIERFKDTPPGLIDPDLKAVRTLGQIIRGKVRPGSDLELDKILDDLTSVLTDGASGIGPGGDASAKMIAIFSALSTKLRRVSEYERRALSLRNKALRRLAYEQIEAERRRPLM
jgi:hypothetical protein